MKIETVNGVLTASAESVEDIKKLLELVKFHKGVYAPVKAPGASTAPAKARVGLRYKTLCPIPGCGKRVKYLGPHTKVMHGEGRGGHTPLDSDIREVVKDW